MPCSISGRAAEVKSLLRAAPGFYRRKSRFTDTERYPYGGRRAPGERRRRGTGGRNRRRRCQDDPGAPPRRPGERRRRTRGARRAVPARERRRARPERRESRRSARPVPLGASRRRSAVERRRARPVSADGGSAGPERRADAGESTDGGRADRGARRCLGATRTAGAEPTADDGESAAGRTERAEIRAGERRRCLCRPNAHQGAESARHAVLGSTGGRTADGAAPGERRRRREHPAAVPRRSGSTYAGGAPGDSRRKSRSTDTYRIRRVRGALPERARPPPAHRCRCGRSAPGERRRRERRTEAPRHRRTRRRTPTRAPNRGTAGRAAVPR